MESHALRETRSGLSLNSLSLTRSSSDSLPQDGHVILGSDTDDRYITQYRIDTDKQLEDLSKPDSSGCFTLSSGKKKSPGKCLWDVIRSEKFLISLHVITLAIGSIKTVIKIKEIDEDLEKIHAGLEVALTILIVTIRLVSVVYHCHKLEDVRQKFEVNTTGGAIASGRTKEVRMCIGVGCALLLADLVAFFCLLYIPGGNLEWTVFSNNLTLVMVTAVVGYTLSLLKLESNMIEADHQKAVIYESILHLGHCLGSESTSGRKKALAQAQHFCKALESTEALAQPPYLTCRHWRQGKPDWQTINTMQVVSMTWAYGDGDWKVHFMKLTHGLRLIVLCFGSIPGAYLTNMVKL